MHLRTCTLKFSITLLLLLLLISPLLVSSQQYVNHHNSKVGSNPSVMGIVLAIVTISVVVMFVVLNLCCQSQVGHEARASDGPSHRARKGLDPSVIETFPVFKYWEVAARAHHSHSGPLECAVCLSQFEDDDQLRLLPKCNHVFHVECLDPWLKGHSTCPLCRVDLVPEASDLDELDRIELGRLASNGRGGEVNQGNNNNNVDCVRVDIEEGYMGKYRRWKSMGHVQVAEMVEGECWKRFTLMLPMKEMMSFGEVTNKFKRTKSSI